jgi:serine/threonine-protein kinase
MKLCVACDRELGEGEAACEDCGAAAISIRTGSDPRLGRIIDGRYELRELIGRGGMATVYRAWQRSVGRDVALKLVHRRYSLDPPWIRRFLSEAGLASQLHHPHTVGILDLGQSAEGDLFLVMELLAGRTFEQLAAAEGVFDAARTRRVGLQICDALVALHQRHIVHGDLTPRNLIILDEPAGRDHVKLLDFGLARIADDDRAVARRGQLVGTPGYMAPELASSPATPATDLYALGVILAELHGGTRLFPPGTFAELQRHKLAGVDLPEAMDASLRKLLRALLDPDPARRPASATEVAARLDAPSAPRSLGQAVPAAPPRRVTAPLTQLDLAATPPASPARSSRRRTWAAVALAAVAGGIGWRLAARAPVTPAADVGDCLQRVERQADSTTAQVWTAVWYCSNQPGPIFANASPDREIGVMKTINSWFVCYRRGTRHEGGNDVWYYTQGDEILPGAEAQKGWGYMPASDLLARIHPYPGVPPCATNAPR